MPCYCPQDCFQLDDGRIVWSVRAGSKVRRELVLPCGGCIGCRLEKSRVWAVRCVHEASMYEESAFVSLTYSDEFLPEHGSLKYADFQSFMKRLRRRFGPVRFFMSGEYGEKQWRPHYHALLFGISFPDPVSIKRGRSGGIFRSSVLEELWPLGYSSFGSVTFESAAYVARYVCKKVGGDAAELHYRRVDPETGEVYSLVPEFGHMSLKPGIGAPWFEKWQRDVFPRDHVVVNGCVMKAPKYYSELLKRVAPFMADDVEYERLSKVTDEMRADSTPERLAVREECESARLRLKRRDLEL